MSMLTVRVPDEDYQRWKDGAWQRRLTLSDLVRDGVESILAQPVQAGPSRPAPGGKRSLVVPAAPRPEEPPPAAAAAAADGQAEREVAPPPPPVPAFQLDLEALHAEDQPQEPPHPLSPTLPSSLDTLCFNAALHWRLQAGERCRFCGGLA